MKLAVSNIAWEPSRTELFLDLLVEEGCQGLEFSSSMVWREPTVAPKEEMGRFRKLVLGRGLTFCSMHSLTYTRPDLNFFSSENHRLQLIEYIVSLGQVANFFEIPVMVFGSGRTRAIGDRNREEAMKILIQSFWEMASKLIPLGITLLIEPLTKTETNTFNSVPEAVSLIKSVNHEGFGLHVDLRSTFEDNANQGEIWAEYGKLVRHCHISDPGFKVPGPDCNKHTEAAQAIRKSGYDKFLSLEIPRISEPETLRKALRFVKKTYIE